MFDTAFVRWVYSRSVAVWLAAVATCGGLGSVPGAAGVTVGFGISLGSLVLTERLVLALFTRGAVQRARRSVRCLVAAAVGKCAVIGAILWTVLRLDWVSAPAVAVGIGLPQAVILVKALTAIPASRTEPDGRS